MSAKKAARVTPAAIRRWLAANGSGATIDIDCSCRTTLIYLDAPRGRIWNESGCHVSCAIEGHGWINECPEWSVALADVQAIVAAGTEECVEANCDRCAEAGIRPYTDAGVAAAPPGESLSRPGAPE